MDGGVVALPGPESPFTRDFFLGSVLGSVLAVVPAISPSHVHVERVFED